MPLQEREMAKAIDVIVENVGACLKWEDGRQNAKVESSFLVCSGTAGIGKTRYGRELYEVLQHQLSPAAEMKGVEYSSVVKYSPHYYYLLLDFGNGVALGPCDDDIQADTIIGLRLAYSRFFGSKYRARFSDFHLQVSKLLGKDQGLFSINNVMTAIRQDLGLPVEQPLFLFLHIDEFQRIFAHPWKGTREGNPPTPPSDDGVHLTGDKTEHHTTEGLCVFKEMMRILGAFMGGTMTPDMIQTFLSGTARPEVTRSAEPTSYRFEFLNCPTLSMGACYDIMSHFSTLANVRHCKWMPKMSFFHLLSATGGLPRALQLLLEEFFGRRLEKCRTFPDTVDNIGMNADHIFIDVANTLNSFYSITAFAEKHKELVRALVRLCILQKPSQRTLVPCDKFPKLTLDVLERYTHTVLDDINESNGMVLVRIPSFFLHNYNKAIGEVRNCLGSAFLRDWVEDREWDFFERIIAEYEALRTNLLIGDDREAATLGEIYQGAVGRRTTTSRTVKLKKLTAVKARRRFPESGGLKVDEQERDWRSDVAFKNAAGARFADVCVYRERASKNGSDILCALQAKKLEKSLSASLLTSEHKKNTSTIGEIQAGSPLGKQGITRARTITVLITTADLTDRALRDLKRSVPDNCLLIYRRNFTEFFGRTFSVSAALAISRDHNWNFATRETLKKYRLKDKVVDQILDNMPYRSYDDLVQKVPALASKDLGEEMGFLLYQDFQPKKKRRVELSKPILESNGKPIPNPETRYKPPTRKSTRTRKPVSK
ncbi:hypothetical protein BG000_005333 [Podila horticola]|nr:hypothetical protein BG000_005333 [Podila horticola]